MSDLYASSGPTSTDNDPERDSRKRTRNRLLVYGGVGVGVVAVAAGVITWAIAAFPAPEKLHSAIATIAAKYECARIDIAVDPSRSVKLGGFVSSADDLKALKTEVQGVQGVGTVDIATTVVPHPHCDVAILFSDPPAADDKHQPKVDLVPENATVTVGSLLKVKVENAPLDSYVYVDFYDQLGKVIHLLPSVALADNHLKAGQSVVIGEEREGGRIYKVTPPIGQQLLTTIVSETPLALTNRPEVEDAKDYLAVLTPLMKGMAPGSFGRRLDTLDIVN